MLIILVFSVILSILHYTIVITSMVMLQYTSSVDSYFQNIVARYHTLMMWDHYKSLYVIQVYKSFL